MNLTTLNTLSFRTVLDFLGITKAQNEADSEKVQAQTKALRAVIEEYAKACIESNHHETRDKLLAKLDHEFEIALRLTCEDKDAMLHLHAAIHRAHIFLSSPNSERVSLLWYASQDTALLFLHSFDALFHAKFKWAEKLFEPFSKEDQKYISNLTILHKALLTSDEKNRVPLTRLDAGFKKLVSLYNDFCTLF